MMILVLLLLVILAMTGVLWFVVKVAFAVALGVFLAIVATTAFIAWRVRRAWRRAMNQQPPPGRVTGGSSPAPPRMQPSSEVTVLRDDGEPRE